MLTGNTDGDLLSVALPNVHELDEEQPKRGEKSHTPRYLREAQKPSVIAERTIRKFPTDLQEIFFPDYKMDDSVHEYLIRAKAALKNDNKYEALRIAEEGIKNYPNSAELYSLSATVRSATFWGRKKAEQLHQKAVQLCPYNEDVRLEYASFLMYQNRDSEADIQRKVVKIHKLDRLSENLCRNNANKKVVQILEEAEEVHNIDKHGLAHQLLERGCDEFPDSVELQIARAYYRHVSAIDSDKAIDAYRKAIEMDPQNPVARTLYAKFLTDFGRFAEARDQVKILLNTYPNNEMLTSYWNSIDDVEKQERQFRQEVESRKGRKSSSSISSSSAIDAFDKIGGKTTSIVVSAAIGGMVGGAIGGYYSQADPTCGPAGVALGAFLGVLFLHMAD